MKKIIILFSCLAILGCSKNEPVLPEPASEEAVSHITKDDLDLIDGTIQLIISREDAIKHGVPASEYDLMEEVLAKHNEGKVQTKAMNSTLAWGALFYKDQDPQYYGRNVATHTDIYGEDMALYYTFSGSNDHDSGHDLYYGLNQTPSYANCVFSWGDSQGNTPLWGFTGSWISLRYEFEGYDVGVCIYEIQDYEI